MAGRMRGGNHPFDTKEAVSMQLGSSSPSKASNNKCAGTHPIAFSTYSRVVNRVKMMYAEAWPQCRRHSPCGRVKSGGSDPWKG
jgi:hypothetical protein